MEEQNKNRLNLVAARTFKSHEEMYKIVDYLNKSLKHKHIMFGLTKNVQDNSMTITIYEF